MRQAALCLIKGRDKTRARRGERSAMIFHIAAISHFGTKMIFVSKKRTNGMKRFKRAASMRVIDTCIRSETTVDRLSREDSCTPILVRPDRKRRLNEAGPRKTARVRGRNLSRAPTYPTMSIQCPFRAERKSNPRVARVIKRRRRDEWCRGASVTLNLRNDNICLTTQRDSSLYSY